MQTARYGRIRVSVCVCVWSFHRTKYYRTFVLPVVIILLFSALSPTQPVVSARKNIEQCHGASRSSRASAVLSLFVVPRDHCRCRSVTNAATNRRRCYGRRPNFFTETTLRAATLRAELPEANSVQVAQPSILR